MKLQTILKIALPVMFMALSTQSFARDDAAITDEIKSKLKQEQTLTPFNIDVMTNNGLVNIKGIVDTDPQAGTVIEIAQATEGVNDVDATNLKIKDSKHPLDDTLITAKVKGMFLREKLFTHKDIKAFGIKVTTQNGVVHLSGKTNDQKQIDNAISIARSIKGVKDVESNLEVKAMTN